MKGEDGDTIPQTTPTVSGYHGESVGTLGGGLEHVCLDPSCPSPPRGRACLSDLDWGLIPNQLCLYIPILGFLKVASNKALDHLSVYIIPSQS